MVILYLLLLAILGVYSYSQVDLNLTLSSQKIFLDFQYWLIQLGYFNRSLSTGLFLIITLLLSIFYFQFIHNSERVSRINILIVIVAIAILGLVSYPAFSHDIFNYIFDARILVVHHANPYTSTALMFPGDTWTRFMNWTHRTYPYGPIFLPITVGVYLLGMHKFVLTLFLFKALMVSSYLGCCYLIRKMAKEKGLLFFALNPLIIYEVVIAGHLDVLMLFLALLAWDKKSKILLLFSAGIKYVTLLLLPLFFRPKIAFLVAATFLGAIIQIGAREILPHYFIVPIGFTALWLEKKRFWVAVALFSILILIIRYYPYLFTGRWISIGVLK